MLNNIKYVKLHKIDKSLKNKKNNNKIFKDVEARAAIARA